MVAKKGRVRKQGRKQRKQVWILERKRGGKERVKSQRRQIMLKRITSWKKEAIHTIQSMQRVVKEIWTDNEFHFSMYPIYSFSN